jgi:hypothetical protein
MNEDNCSNELKLRKMRAVFHVQSNFTKHWVGKKTFSDCCEDKKEAKGLNPDETLTVDRVKHYLSITERARAKATTLASTTEEESMVTTLLSMADDYASDAQYFLKQGDLIRAFGAINYAHAWIDAGVKLRLLDGHGDDVLFTLP